TTTEPGGSTEPGGTTTSTTEPGGSTEPGGTTTTTTEPGGTTTTTTKPVTTTTTTEPGGTTTTTTKPVTTTTTKPGSTTTTTKPVTTTTTEPGGTTTTTTTEPVTTTTTEPVTTTTTTEPITTTSTTTTEPGVITTTTTIDGPVGPGEGTTTTTTSDDIILEGDTSVTVAIRDGYFFSHDPRSFPADMVIAKYVIENGNPVAFDSSKVTFEDTVNGGSTPMAAYRETQTDFTYKLNVFYDGKPVYLKDGTRAVATAYIGVKGDANLDNVADAVDASYALVYYAKIMTGQKPEETNLNDPNVNELVANKPELDLLGKLLVDVNNDCYSKANWSLGHDRVIDATDASFVLVFYSKVMTSETYDAYQYWIETLGPNYKESFENFRDNGVDIPMVN
ncbi:MAG: cellulose-binding protein CttA-related protein, partial [Ruminococcus sp.]|nr:cellulose-binding protein CttA-related protein [Ruminococcus sp.]